MSTQNRFDAHCHIFTIKYVLKEAKRILHDMYFNTYPWEKPEYTEVARIGKEKLTNFKQTLRWLFELTGAALISERHNFNFLKYHGKKAFPGDGFSIIPLMMDVYYLFAYPLNIDEDHPETIITACELSNYNDLQTIWDEVLNDLKNHLIDLHSDLHAKKRHVGGIELTEILFEIDKEKIIKKIEATPLQKNAQLHNVDYFHTEGFDHHKKKLMELVRTNRGELYPFIAVDPRRPGIIETVMSGKFFVGRQRFYGVKLYPRMGYHPQCKPLMPLYKYCSDNNIPITFHCGMSGFPPGIHWKWAQFGDPINFEPIVKQFPNLRVNFAHMGSNDTSHTWERTIVRLIKTYPNVYTDLSCYTNLFELQDMLPYLYTHPEMQSKLMYGSDYDVMYFTGNKITMTQYINNFKRVFPYNLKHMMVDNPKMFLGVEEKPLNCLQKLWLWLF